MKNFSISLGIGLNMFLCEYFAVIEHSQEVPVSQEAPISWSIKYLQSIGLTGKQK